MEQWKEIFPDYHVSTLGNVDSTKRKKRRRLRPHAVNGYMQVSLTVSGQQKDFKVHRLVAQAFIPNPDNKPQVNHINGVKIDNRLENLEWVTGAENKQHAVNTGLQKSGEDSYQARFTNEQVRYIRNNPDGLNTYELAEKFKIGEAAISRIQLGYVYKTAGGVIRAKQARLTDEQRTQIKQSYIKGSSTEGCYGLAKKYGVNPVTIWYIVNKK